MNWLISGESTDCTYPLTSLRYKSMMDHWDYFLVLMINRDCYRHGPKKENWMYHAIHGTSGFQRLEYLQQFQRRIHYEWEFFFFLILCIIYFVISRSLVLNYRNESWFIYIFVNPISNSSSLSDFYSTYLQSAKVESRTCDTNASTSNPLPLGCMPSGKWILIEVSLFFSQLPS